jgi:hypothetical protein
MKRPLLLTVVSWVAAAAADLAMPEGGIRPVIVFVLLGFGVGTLIRFVAGIHYEEPEPLPEPEPAPEPAPESLPDPEPYVPLPGEVAVTGTVRITFDPSTGVVAVDDDAGRVGSFVGRQFMGARR